MPDMPPRSASVRPVTEHDLQVAKDIGQMQADIRTVKHDVANVQQGMVGLGSKLDAMTTQFNEKMTQVTNQQSKGLGFFAGAATIITLFGGVMALLIKVLWTGKIGS